MFIVAETAIAKANPWARAIPISPGVPPVQAVVTMDPAPIKVSVKVAKNSQLSLLDIPCMFHRSKKLTQSDLWASFGIVSDEAEVG